MDRFLKMPFLKEPLPAEEAEAISVTALAVRASSILAFIECDDELRPKLREPSSTQCCGRRPKPEIAMILLTSPRLRGEVGA